MKRHSSINFDQCITKQGITTDVNNGYKKVKKVALKAGVREYSIFSNIFAYMKKKIYIYPYAVQSSNFSFHEASSSLRNSVERFFVDFCLIFVFSTRTMYEKQIEYIAGCAGKSQFLALISI